MTERVRDLVAALEESLGVAKRKAAERAARCPAGHECHRAFPPGECRDYEQCEAERSA